LVEGHLPTEIAELALEPESFERLIEAMQKLIGVDRLHEIIGCAGANRFHRIVDAAEAGEHDDWSHVAIGPHHSNELDPVDSGQLKVAENEIDVAAFEDMKRCPSVACLHGLVTRATEDLHEDSEHRRIIFDAKNAGHGRTLPGVNLERQSKVQTARSKGPGGPIGLARRGLSAEMERAIAGGATPCAAGC
jgi:hypothetical protein